MTKTTKTYLLLAAGLVIAVIAIYGYKEYHRKPADLTGVTPQITLTAEALVGNYESDETVANQLYLGKVIQVSGTLAEISIQDTLLNVVIGNETDMHKVSCALDIKQQKTLQQFQKGNLITVKGLCTGYLLDVEMNRGVIVK